MNYLRMIVAVVAVVSFSSISVYAAEDVHVRHVSGEVTWVDVKLGKLQLKSDIAPTTGEVREYRITEHETRVTNPSDKKFLSVVDLQPGQHVRVDVIDGQGEKIVQKITVDPRRVAGLQEAYGVVEAVDAAGTLTLSGRSEGENRLFNFVFEPKDLVVMQSPSREPVQLVVKPGDIVKVEYAVKDGKQWARAITMYAMKVMSTTTTTTVITTQ